MEDEIIVTRESGDDLLKDGMPLFQADWDETAVFVNTPMSLNIDYYRELEKSGHLLLVTARDKGVLVGYINFIVGESAHEKEICLQCAGLFVSKPYRGKKLAQKLMIESQKLAKEAGISYMRISSSAKRDVGPLFERMGGVKEETVYGFRF